MVAWGKEHKCRNFRMCHLCYKCRNYSSSIVECKINCGKDIKNNVCKVELHTEDNVGKMVAQRTVINVKKVNTDEIK